MHPLTGASQPDRAGHAAAATATAIIDGDSGQSRPYLQVRQASKNFGSFCALDGVSFSIRKGEFICFLGPSGCGKTTLLRCIAGLETLSSGTIIQDAIDISDRPPAKRDFGIVFQSYALFPNLTVHQNIAFGLEGHGHGRKAIGERVTELINIVGLAGQEQKYPAQLSGGQQQRVALARALAPSPGLLLLDEPLSALDAKVRVRLRREIKRIQRLLGITTIMVTHDQEEALTIADRIIVMRDGRIDQMGDSDSIYRTPATPFVADFIGTMNFVTGSVNAQDQIQCEGLSLTVSHTPLVKGTAVVCAFRPEHLTPIQDGQPVEGGNVFDGTITDTESLGASTRIFLQASLSGSELKAVLHDTGRGPFRGSIGDRFLCQVRPEHIHVFEHKEHTS